MTPLYPTVSSVCMFCDDSLSDAIVSEHFICLYVLHRQLTQQYRHEHMRSCALDSRSYGFSTTNRDCLNCHQTYFKCQDALLRKGLQHSRHLLLRKRRICPLSAVFQRCTSHPGSHAELPVFETPEGWGQLSVHSGCFPRSVSQARGPCFWRGRQGGC